MSDPTISPEVGTVVLVPCEVERVYDVWDRPSVRLITPDNKGIVVPVAALAAAGSCPAPTHHETVDLVELTSLGFALEEEGRDEASQAVYQAADEIERHRAAGSGAPVEKAGARIATYVVDEDDLDFRLLHADVHTGSEPLLRTCREAAFALTDLRAAAAAAPQPPTAAEVLTDLRGRLTGKAPVLHGMADAAAAFTPEAFRLGGKAEGVDLAISFVDEALRLVPAETPGGEG